MRLAADQFEEPLGPEFEETLDEINFGVSVPDALRNLALRVDCPDLKYFVVSVILQRQTGGNLAEIIGNIAHVIRERFKFHGKVRVLAAEGRLSAYVLMGLPLMVVLALKFTSPKYIETLWVEPAGRVAGAIALCLMFVGVLVMRKMIKIEV
jgi:tight adherence protein B